MKIGPLILLTLLLWPARLFSADTPPATPPQPVDSLTEVLSILQKNYVDFGALNYKAGDKLTDLISRSGGKITIIPAEALSPAPIVTDSLADGTVYVRLASFVLPTGQSWPDLAAQVQKAGNTTPGIILDLRSNSTPDDYTGALTVRDFFKPPFHAPIVILTNGRTTGAAEALAGFLQANGALVVGRPTAGQVTDFDQTKLSSGQILRYAVAPAASNDPIAAFKFNSVTPAWSHPIIPDITPVIDEHSEKAALVLIRENHLSDVIGESPERHRMSEAALQHEQDPEWDDYLASLQDKPVLLSLPVIHDAALITALDSLKAIRVSQLTSPAPKTADRTPPGAASVQ